MQHYAPTDSQELRDIVLTAGAKKAPLMVKGGGSQCGVGRPVECVGILDMAAFSGITSYEPAELVLIAKAATPLSTIERLLSENNQTLAFEPGHQGAFFDVERAQPTLAGALMSNLAGPRRLSAGAARDHFLGFQAVSGAGVIFKAGGTVVKNVTGFDLMKVMAGSWGTLAVMTEVAIKVVPAPRVTTTLCVFGLSANDACTLMAQACSSTAVVSGAAHLTPRAAQRSTTADIAAAGKSATLIRLEGFEAGMDARLNILSGLLAPRAETLVLRDAAARTLWQEVGVPSHLFPKDTTLWRTYCAPRDGWRFADDGDILDWAGGLVWRAGEEPPAAPDYTLWRGSKIMRARYGGAKPRNPALATISARLKRAFDPQDILNRGRLVPHEENI